MIQPYVRPRDTITQIIQERNNGSTQRLNALVVGSNYRLARYGEETLPGNDFDAGGDTLEYRWTDSAGAVHSLMPETETADLAYAALWGEDLRLPLADYINNFSVPDSNRPERIVANDGSVLKGTGLHAYLKGRDLRVGDIVRCTDGSTTVERKITGFIGKSIQSGYASAASASPANPPASAAAESVVSASGSLSVSDVAVAGDFTPDWSGLPPRYHGTTVTERFTVVCTTSGSDTTSEWKITPETHPEDAVTVTAASNGGNISIASAAAAPGLTFNLDVAAATAGDGFVVDATAAYDSPASAIVPNGTYTGLKDTNIIVEVVEGGTGSGTDHLVDLRISDSTGLYTPQTQNGVDVSLLATIDDVLGCGLTLSITADSSDVFAAGDRYYVECTAAAESTTAFDGAILDGPAVDTQVFDYAGTIDTVAFQESWSAKLSSANVPGGGDPLAAAATGASYPAGLQAVIYGRTSDSTQGFVNGLGKVYLEWRAYQKPASTESTVLVQDKQDVEDKLGDLDPDNELAWAAYMALKGAGGLPVYYLRTEGDGEDAVKEALKKISFTDSVYALNILSDDADALLAVRDHVEEMSEPTRKNFRRMYIGTESPGEYTLLDEQADGNPFTAKFSPYGTRPGALVAFEQEEADLVGNGVRAGDKIVTSVSGEDETYVVSAVLSATELVLEQGPPTGIDPAQPVKLVKADNADNTVDYVVSVSEKLGNRRCVNVWCDRPEKLVGADYRTVHPKFTASEIAGLRVYMPPQLGLTYTELQSIDKAPRMYTAYTESQLDRASASGVFVVTQEAEGGPCFVRHQLTTETEKGLLYYEDSVGVNADDFSFQVKDMIRGFTGHKNVTRQTLHEVEAALFHIAAEASQADGKNLQSGPQIVGFENEKGEPNAVTVEVSPESPDRIRTYVRILVPTPLNGIDNYVAIDISETITL